jgi:hypothetical protein
MRLQLFTPAEDIIRLDPENWKLHPETGTISAKCHGFHLTLTPQNRMVLYWQMLHAAGVNQHRCKSRSSEPFPQMLN